MLFENSKKLELKLTTQIQEKHRYKHQYTIPFRQHIVCLALREELIGECLLSNLSTAGGGLGELQDEMLLGVLSVHPLSLINLKY